LKTKDYLNQARSLDKRIDSKLEQVERLRSLAERTTTVLSWTPKGNSNENRTEYCIQKIWELEKEINADIDDLIDKKREIASVINTVQDDQHRMLLEHRYLCCKTWEDIAKAMSYDLRWIYRMHGRALQELGHVTPCIQRDMMSL
jgi:transcriptional regulator with XRE-family HTH domain